MKNRPLSFSVLLTTLLLFNSCTVVDVSSDYNRDYNFPETKTFAFYALDLKSLELNDMQELRVYNEIGENLKSKGLVYTTDIKNADLVVNVKSETVEVQEESINPDVQPLFFANNFAPNNSPVFFESVDSNEAIYIELYDLKNQSLVWQGVGRELEIYDDYEKSYKISLALEQIMAKYPPKQKG